MLDMYHSLKGMNTPFKWACVNAIKNLDKRAFYAANYGHAISGIYLRDVVSMYIMGGEL